MTFVAGVALGDMDLHFAFQVVPAGHSSQKRVLYSRIKEMVTEFFPARVLQVAVTNSLSVALFMCVFMGEYGSVMGVGVSMCVRTALALLTI